MKKFALTALLVMTAFLSGCNNRTEPTTQPSTPQPTAVTQPTEDNETKDEKFDKAYVNELKKYGENTVRRNGYTDLIEFSTPEVGNGKFLNDDESRPIDKWYLVTEERTDDGLTEKTYPLIIDETCLIHGIGFKNGSCLKYLSLDERKNVVHDGYNGPSMVIHGETLSDGTVRVSDMIISQ